jgi:hypothetical protein
MLTVEGRRGGIRVMHESTPFSAFSTLILKREAWMWKPAFERVTGLWTLHVPYWIPTIVLGVATGMFFGTGRRARRWARTGCCLACGYDRGGLAKDAVCPECGKQHE